MSGPKWWRWVGPEEYEPTLKCRHCGNWVFPAPEVTDTYGYARGVRLLRESRWVHIHSLKVECVKVSHAHPDIEGERP